MIEPTQYWSELPKVVWPPESDHVAARGWQHIHRPLFVLRSISTIQNGEQWIHVSVSRPDRLPNWNEVRGVKEEFLGDVEAYHMLPKQEDYVNVHEYCLHLWAPVDGKRRVANLQDLTDEKGI